MVRDFFITGECLVLVKSRSDSSIGSLTQLGLSPERIAVTPIFKHKDINVDAWGEAAVDVQWMLAEARVRMTLVHYDRSVIDECMRLSMGFPTAVGQLARAGTRLGGGLARFAVGNNYIGLNLTAPIGNKPWRFYYAYLMGQPEFPLGVEKSVVTLDWRVLPYTTDPWGGGTGAQNYVLWDYANDT